MSGDVQVREQAITLGWRTAAALVMTLVASAISGTWYVASRVAHLETALVACSAVPELAERVQILETRMAWVASEADVGWPAGF